MTRVLSSVLAPLALVASGSQAPAPERPRAHWAENGCDHGYARVSARRGIRAALRPPASRRARARHFVLCTRSESAERAMRKKMRWWLRWRRSYRGKWRLRWELLPAIGRSWARSTASCETGGTMDQHAYNPDGPWYSLFQWSLTTWWAAGGVGHPYNASFHHQAALAWPWHLSHPTGQWPACGE